MRRIGLSLLTLGLVVISALNPISPVWSAHTAPVPGVGSTPLYIWIGETVDTGDTGPYSSLVLDAAGYPHVSYFDSDNVTLKYAYYDGAVWHTETVDSFSGVGWHNSLDLDAAGRPHISYYDNANLCLKYAHHDGTTWHTETVDCGTGGSRVGTSNSLKVDAAGRPHIAYYVDLPVGDLRHAWFDGVAWHIETVVSAGDVGEYATMDLDTADRPHIAYINYSVGLQYGRFDGTQWVTSTVDHYGSGSLGYIYPSLKLDAADQPHVSYGDNRGLDNGILLYAYLSGTTWLTETVDAAGAEQWFSSLALDAQDRPHIAYWDGAISMVKYAAYDGIAWTTEVVENSGGTPSLALDAAGRPRITHYSWDCVCLRYVYPCTSLGSVAVGGPAQLWTWETGLYTATYAPLTATMPISWTWDNGAAGPTAAYSWTVPGVYTVTATAANACSAASGERGVEVLCRPLAGAQVSGPAGLLVGEEGSFAASYTPTHAALPVSVSWDNGTAGFTSVYSWTAPGIYTVTAVVSNPCSQITTTWAVEVRCQPVEAVTLTGPLELLVGQAGRYTATTAPVTASLPLTSTWSNGTAGPTAVYSWTQGGAYAISVTATNLCSERSAALAVAVCQPVEEVAVAGPVEVPAGVTAWYTATYTPLDATGPVTVTWDNGAVGTTAAYSWTMPGAYTVTVTATGRCGVVGGGMGVLVRPVYRVYLPLSCRSLSEKPRRLAR